MKRKFFTLATVVLIAAAGSAFTILRNPASTPAQQVSTVWYFTGESIGEAEEATNWTTQNPQLGCGSGTALPCQMTVADAPDQESLQHFLDDKTGTEIRDNYASSKRAE